ncbi:MAG: hypothetical protein KQH63_10035 [Desulfobulbaceae bacterium]|nr:hypothetical protein [Desulfobulbaceae bacterium]
MRIKIFITLLLGTLLFAVPITSQSKVTNATFPTATITQYGYYEFVVETKRYKTDSSPSGYAQKEGEPLLVEHVLVQRELEFFDV